MKFYLLLMLVVVLSQVYHGDAISLNRYKRQASRYIIRLVPTCPPSITAGSLGKLELQADVPSEAQAYCKNGNLTFSSANRPIYELTVVLSSPTANQCQFFKKANINVYTAHVVYGWGDPGSPIFTYTKQELVTCSYDGYGNMQSSLHQIQDFPLAPGERAYYLGNLTQIPVSLSVINILDQAIDGQDIIVGRTIRLRATVDASYNNTSIRALSCFAQNSGGANFSVLRGGCGDGQIFKKSDGFTTEGNLVFSPYFKTFKLHSGNDLQFRCSFVVCPGNCDGSSCSSLRRKRVVTASAGFRVHTPGPLRVEAIAMILVHERLQQYITISTGTAAKDVVKGPKGFIKVISFEKLNIVNEKKKRSNVTKVKSSNTAAKVSDENVSMLSNVKGAEQTLAMKSGSEVSSVSQKLISEMNYTDTVKFDTDSIAKLQQVIPKDGSVSDETTHEKTATDEFQYASESIFLQEIDIQSSGSVGRVLNEDLPVLLSTGIVMLDSEEEDDMEPIGVDDVEVVEFKMATMQLISEPLPEQDNVVINNDKLLLINEPEPGHIMVPATFEVTSFTFFVAMTVCSLIVIILVASGVYLFRRSRAQRSDKMDVAIIATAHDINRITKDFEDVKIDDDGVCDRKPDIMTQTMAAPPKPSDTYIM